MLWKNFLDKPIARAAAEKYFEGDYDKNVAMILFNDNEAAKEYSQCEELVPPSERAFSEKAMSTKLSKRIDAILNNGEPSVLTSIHVLTGITFMHEHQRESDLAELIIKSAKEFEI